MIEVSEDQAAALKFRAQEQGTTVEDCLEQILEERIPLESLCPRVNRGLMHID